MRLIWIPVWLLTASAPAATADTIWLAGGEVGPGSAYAYTGLVAPLGADSRLGDGWFQRYWLDWLSYTYDGADGEVTARAPGGEVALGYQWPVAGGGMELSAGALYRDTRLDPAATDSEVAGGRWGGKLQWAGWMNGDAWHLRGIANYVVGPQAYWARLRVYRGRGGGWWPGAEAVALGDPEYDAVQLGGLLGRVPAGPGRELTFKVGARLEASDSASPYAGIELVWGGEPPAYHP